jgi:hypothetical protein
MKKQRLNQWRSSPIPEKVFCDNLLALFNESRIAWVANKATLERDGFRRIREEVLWLDRAEYGEPIVATLSRQLATEYGRGFEETRLENNGKDNE